MTPILRLIYICLPSYKNYHLLNEYSYLELHDQGIKKLCLAGIKFRHPHAPLETICASFACAILGEKLSPQFQPKGKNENMWIQDSIALAGELHQLLTSINISYYVSGGVASSIHGEPRSTRD